MSKLTIGYEIEAEHNFMMVSFSRCGAIGAGRGCWLTPPVYPNDDYGKCCYRDTICNN